MTGIMTRWSHGHTAAVGFAGGLVIDRHVLYVFFLGLLLGALVVYSSRTLRSVGRAGASRVAELHSLAVNKLRAEINRKEAATVESTSKADHRVRTKKEQDKELERAYIRGVADGDPRREAPGRTHTHVQVEHFTPRTVESDLLEDR